MKVEVSDPAELEEEPPRERRRSLRIRGHYLIVGGQAVGQLSMLAITPILTRAFTPAELGDYQIATAIALVILPLTTLRYEFVIPISKSGHATRRFLRRSASAVITANLLLCATSLACLLFGKNATASMLAMTSMINIMYSWMALDNALLVRAQKIRKLAVRNLLSGLFSSAFQLLVVVLAPRAFALAAAVLVGRLLAIAFTRSGRISHRSIGDGVDDVAYGPVRAAFTVASELVAGAAIHGLTFTSAALLGRGPAAYVATAQRVSGVPAALVGQGIGQAVQAVAAKAVNSGQGRLGPNMLRAGIRLAVFAAAVGLSVAILGPVLAVPVLGDQWEAVGTILPILAAPIALRIIASALGPVLVMIGRERLALVQQITQLVAGVGIAGAVAIMTSSLIWTVAAYSAVAVIAYATYLVLIIKCVNRFDAEQTL